MAVASQAFEIARAAIVAACMAAEAVNPGAEECARSGLPAGAVRLPATDGRAARVVFFRYDNKQDFLGERWRPVVLRVSGEIATNVMVSDWGRASYDGDSRSRRMR